MYVKVHHPEETDYWFLGEETSVDIAYARINEYLPLVLYDLNH